MAMSSHENGTEGAGSQFASRIAQTQSPLHQARHLPGDFYTSQETYELEKERIFLQDWLCVGRVEEFEKPGDYLTLCIADEPIVVVRDEDGQLNAFYNVCRHRGTEVAVGQGNTTRFQCPYHGWTYDLCGRLRGAAYTKEIENFDMEQYGLVPLKLDTWGGFVFLNFDPNCESLLEFLGDFPEVFGPYQPEDLRLAIKFVIEYDCNWKATAENLVDIYHLATLHASSFGPYQPLESYEFQLKRWGYYGRFKGVSPMTHDGKPRFDAMPWLSGEHLEKGYSSHLQPNMGFYARQDNIHYITEWPIGTNRSMALVHMLFPKQRFYLPDFKERIKVYEDFLHVALEEDMSMVQSLQRGFRSRAYQPGPMSKYEIGVHHVMNYYLDKVYGEQQ